MDRRTLKEKLEINKGLPIMINQPLIVIPSDNVSIQSVEGWINNDMVRGAFERPLVNIRHFHEDIGLSREEHIRVFDNTSIQAVYKNYVNNILIKQVRGLLGRSASEEEDIIIFELIDKLKRLVKGDVGLTRQDLQRYLKGIYPNVNVIQMPNVGNCYFCSIGAGLNLTPDEIREDISDYATYLYTEFPEDYQEFIS